jgi:hypothetical protein
MAVDFRLRSGPFEGPATVKPLAAGGSLLASKRERCFDADAV